MSDLVVRHADLLLLLLVRRDYSCTQQLYALTWPTPRVNLTCWSRACQRRHCEGGEMLMFAFSSEAPLCINRDSHLSRSHFHFRLFVMDFYGLWATLTGTSYIVPRGIHNWSLGIAKNGRNPLRLQQHLQSPPVSLLLISTRSPCATLWKTSHLHVRNLEGRVKRSETSLCASYPNRSFSR